MELHLLLAEGCEHWLQFEHSQFTLAHYLQDGDRYSFSLQGEEVRWHTSGPPARYQGVEVTQATLSVGDCLELGEHRLWLMDARMPEVARLETRPGPSETWSLKPQAYRLGRRGQNRLNHIELNHPTISRAQATLIPMPSGRFGILAESASSPTRVNGKSIPVGQIHSLQHGDLLQLGEISLRFHHSSHGSAPPRSLRVRSLGGFGLLWGDRPIAETDWKSSKARLLMARLALAWDQPLATEYLMELLWPDLTPIRGRKNLSQCLSELKESLKIRVESELLLRTPATLQLKPEILAEHDVITFRELTGSADVSGWSKALQLYQGPYLPDLLEEWALCTRQETHLQALDASQKLTQHLLKAGLCEQAMATAQRGLGWDPCHQTLAQLFMEAALQSKRPEEAIRCYDSIRNQLKKTFSIEPNTELIRAHLAARGQLAT